MNISTENAVIKAVKNFTPEQLETCGRDVEWANKKWNDEGLARYLSNLIPNCSPDALILAMQQNDVFQTVMYDIVAAAICNQHALDMLNYSATFDEVA
ncbi:hypothetical protein [Sodalis sp. RH22]|uniref:hypothetical protein n=1 Tax=unclassified Sodalis (in: enterobacteria) TaxID=2636512 RepID=UPI0039B53363